jgi:putative ABC transport system ATP-binding protein
MPEPLLAVRGVEKSYRRGKRSLRVLRDVSLSVAAGEIVAVVGTRFEGKTTLLRIAAGMELPDAGEVWFAGRELTRMPLGERERLWRDEIAWVSRDAGSLGFEILDYLTLARRFANQADVESVAMTALERVGLPAAIAGCRWEELSNWEQVLVAIARGIAVNPRLIVIDDVVDGLGPSKTRQASELLCSLAKKQGCAILMSASDAEAAMLADQIWMFEGSQLGLMAGSSPEGNIIDFPGGPSRRRDSSGFGS